MNIILLSGGSGKRLWPLSNDVRSKQFIKIFNKPEHSVPLGMDAVCEYESMVQRVYRQIKTVAPDANVTIATSKSQVSAIHNQLGHEVGISIEPCRRDTFAAIALATAYLHDVKGIDADEAVVVCPIDPYVDEGYFKTLNELYEAAQSGTENLILMGIKPTYPSEKYGYIKPVKQKGNQHWSFTEKPNKAKVIPMIEPLYYDDRYCSIVAVSKPLRISRRQENCVSSYYYGNNVKTTDRKSLLTSLKNDLESESLDFLRYSEPENVQRMVA